MDLTNLHLVSASEAARLIRDGAISSVELVEACLARVRDVDERVQAWAFLDPELALAQARAADEFRLSGQPIGPLHTTVTPWAICMPSWPGTRPIVTIT